MPKVSLKLDIAGRIYPISVLETEKDRVLQAVSSLNEAIESLKKQYAVNDLQDLMAMASLQLMMKANQRYANDLALIDQKLDTLEKEISTI
jgi:cell division protein ZapA